MNYIRPSGHQVKTMLQKKVNEEKVAKFYAAVLFWIIWAIMQLYA